MTPSPGANAAQTKGRTLPRWLQTIQAHNEAYNRRILLRHLVTILTAYHASKTQPSTLQP